MRASRTLAGFMLVVMSSMTALAATPPVLAQATPCADLIVSDLTVSPAQPIEGQNAVINVTVHNQGSCSALGFVVQWKPTLLTPPLSSQVGGLGAGASTTLTFNYIYPNAGSFISEAVADSSRTVNETNEFNNSLPKLITVLKSGVDLIVTDIAFNPSPPVQGRPAQATITVQNLGNSAAGDFVVQWKPTLLASDLSVQVNGLGPGAIVSVTFDYTYAIFGEFVTVATADSTHKVFEVDETNNSLSMPLTVQPPRPDLVIASLTIHPSQPVEGLAATVTVVVHNQGNTPAEEFMVQWKPSLLAPDLSQQVNGLDVGQSRSLTFDYTYLFPGEFTSVAEVDSTKRVLELDETNNTAMLQVTVQKATVDLLITSLTIAPSQPTQGAPATVSVVVQNQGNSPSGPFVVEWNPDVLGRLTPGPSKLSTQVDNVGPGASRQVNFTFVYPEQGSFLSMARVDARNDVRETDETNNLASLTVTVLPGIDLVITGFTINPASPVRASTATANITVRNQGIYPAGTFWVQWKPVEDGFGGPTAKVDGLNPGQSKTVTLEGTYFQAGDFESLATVDVFNQVIESNEGNNTATRSVTVQPRQTTVRVTFTSVHIIEAAEDGLICTDITPCDAEWAILFLVFDPNVPPSATCSFRGSVSIPNFRCSEHTDGSVEDGDTLNVNRAFQVTLVESTPLILGTFALEEDDFIGIPTGADFMGFTFQLHTPGDRWGEGSHTVTAQQGDPCEACYRVNYTVQIISEPPPLADEGTGTPALEYVTLPGDLALLPQDVVLPDFVRRVWNLYLPLIVE